jgi:hypothetical protein
LKQTGENPAESIRMIPSPDGQKVVYIMNGIWIYDIEREEHVLLGSGTFLGWIDHHQVAWYVSYNEAFPAPYY